MPGFLTKFRKRVSRLCKCCSCCRSSSVNVISSVNNTSCNPSKPIALKSKSIASVEISNQPSVHSDSTVSQSGILPKLEDSSMTESSSVSTVSPVVIQQHNNHLPSTEDKSTDDCFETIENKVENTDSSTVKNDIKDSTEAQDDSSDVKTVARTSRPESVGTSKAVEETPDTTGKFRELTYAEKINKMPLTHMVGHYNQCTVQGRYSGAQCTVMALTALAYQYFLDMAHWSLDNLDSVVWAGDYHHTLFRDMYHYSTNPDYRIALDELPSRVRLSFGEANGLLANIGVNSGLLFLSQTNQTRPFGLPTLKEYLERETSTLTAANFVITISSLSHGIVKDKNGHWLLFDSHGTLRIPAPVYELGESGQEYRIGATLTRFDSLDTLIAVLLDNHAAGSPCEARMITVTSEQVLDTDRMRQPSRASIGVSSQPATARSRSSTAPPITDAVVEDVPEEDIIALE